MKHIANRFYSRSDAQSVRGFVHKYIGVCSFGVLLCLLVFFKVTKYEEEDELIRVLHSHSYHSALTICAAFSLPMLTDPFMEYLETGRLSVFKWFKVTLLLWLGVPNMVLLVIDDSDSHDLTAQLYLFLTYAQMIVLLGGMLGQLHYLGSNIWTGDRIIALVALSISFHVCSVCYHAFHFPALGPIAAAFGILFLLSFAWYSWEWFVSDDWLSVYQRNAWISQEAAMRRKQEYYSSSRRIRSYSTYACTWYIVLVWLFFARVLIFAFGFTMYTAVEVNSRVYAEAVVTLLVIIVQDRRIYLQLTESQDELQNKRIFVQYVTQEASNAIMGGKKAVRAMMSDLTTQIKGFSSRATTRPGAGEYGGGGAVPVSTAETMQQLGMRLESLAVVDEACEASLKYLKDLLTFDKFERDLILSNREEVAVGKLIRNQVDFFATQASFKRVLIRTAIGKTQGAGGSGVPSLPVPGRDGEASGAPNDADVDFSESMLPKSVNDASIGMDDVISSATRYRSMFSPGSGSNNSSSARRQNLLLRTKNATLLINTNKIAQVLRFIIGNAITHTPYNTTVTVRVSLKEVSKPTATIGSPGRKTFDLAGLRSSSASSSNMMQDKPLHARAPSSPRSPRIGHGEDEEGSYNRSGSGSRRQGSWHGMWGAGGGDMNPDDYVVRIEVIDKGAGIPKAKQAALFSKKALEGYQSGKLSLWLCRMIVEMHGGSFGVESPVFYPDCGAEASQGLGGSTGGGRGLDVAPGPPDGGVGPVGGDLEMGDNGLSGGGDGAASGGAEPVGTKFFIELPVHELSGLNNDNSISNSILSNRQVRIAPGDDNEVDFLWGGRTKDRLVQRADRDSGSSGGGEDGYRAMERYLEADDLRCSTIQEAKDGSSGEPTTGDQGEAEHGRTNRNIAAALKLTPPFASRLLANAAALIGLSGPKGSVYGGISGDGSVTANSHTGSGGHNTPSRNNSNTALPALVGSNSSSNTATATAQMLSNQSENLSHGNGNREGGSACSQNPPMVLETDLGIRRERSRGAVGGGGNLSPHNPNQQQSTHSLNADAHLEANHSRSNISKRESNGSYGASAAGQSAGGVILGTMTQARSRTPNSAMGGGGFNTPNPSNATPVRVQKYSDPIPIQWKPNP